MTQPATISADYTLRPSELASVARHPGRGPPADHSLGPARGGEIDDRPAGRGGRQPPLRRRSRAPARPRRLEGHSLARRRRPTIPASGSSTSRSLPQGASLIACGNRETDRGVVHRMPTPLSNRFVHLEIRVDPEDWLAWGAANGIAPEVLFFITYESDLLHQFDPQSKERAFPTPRS